MPHGFTFDASWGGVRIDVTSTNIRQGRKKTAHTFPKRDGATLEDSGRQPYICDLEFVFIDRKALEGEEFVFGDFLERFQAFDALVDSDVARRFVHPYVGAKLCGISDFNHNSTGEGQPVIRCSATFTEETPFTPTVDNGPGVQTLVGSHEVESRALLATQALEDTRSTLTDDELSIASGELQGTIVVVENWDLDPDLTARDVQLQMASVNNTLNRRLDLLNVDDDIDRYAIMREYTRLQHEVRRAAEAFTTETTRIVTIRVNQPLPLRIIASRFYGASEANFRFDQLLELNPGLRNPARVEAGVELKAFARDAVTGSF